MSKTISFKFRKPESIETALERINQIPDVGKIECLFHDAVDSKLATFYATEVESSALAEVLKKLREDPDVEYAYEAPPRRPT